MTSKAEHSEWKLVDEVLAIDWMTIPPSQNAVLELLSCGCVTSCDTNRCICRVSGFKCTDMCKLKDSTNALTNEIEVFYESESEQSDSSDDDNG